ncbi:adenine-specific methyltransferase EcoRI family protein [Gemelliphila palaticanis]|uniref:Adenine-specific methyltransferase EcoRI family protein n=1 Tax=Gemelliphila palaticanis TaxID=81950 RepID=A0ABX2SZQ9_9BACL|nr:adenine-specific methyltransferase EcoRI family protein [Gemella palaticanis]MBF0715941.1 adenine-specific methyltransferase EcoRI family protein [Gemella palaticanis]NYS47871.1 adenine-specific methyltransferase EcoRI family protein [Gemella palaticanis]
MRKNENDFLRKAKKNKNDEFYTQYKDIENELQHYKTHFKGKIVFCNCDDPITSNFFKYFVDNFEELGLKKVIGACYISNEYDIFDYENKQFKSGYYYEYSSKDTDFKEVSKDNVIHFKGDGDFRSIESIELLKKADIVVTNPPFSLFREFISLLIEYKKKFLIIGNINAITYKEIFKLIQNNKVWLGINLGRGISGFIVPKHYELYGTETNIDEIGNRIVSTNNCLWLTNLDNFKRHEDIELKMTYEGNENNYPKYDNYNGINVNKTKDIPSDYKGHMGVPITFLHKFNPEQFEIIKFRKGDDDKDLCINGKSPYFRILIKNKRV